MRRYLADFSLKDLPRVTADVLVVGTGIAGLYTALKVRDVGRVVVLTKGRLEESNTGYAQGGIAAAIGQEDSPMLHLKDTLEAGAGLCDEHAVRVLVEEGPACVMELAAMGTHFDRAEEGYALTREGAHSIPRILHARGDATGDEIRRALQERVAAEQIDVLENHYIVDVLTVGNRCWGVLALDASARLTAYLAKATILCTGGAGQLYVNSTNPEIATGDGIAIAYRAGAEVEDVEFIQFHPTALYHEGSPKFLVSEAVRGEGAYLLNARGERFMFEYDPRAELAPRDVVARAIVDQMRKTGAPHVWLDARHLPDVASRFPTIYAGCRRRGVNMEKDWIPVAPAAHYIMGGVRTDEDGRTGIPGLYACGEVACTGIHGANRLASNSLLEGLVFGRRIADQIRRTIRAVPDFPAELLALHYAGAAGNEPPAVPEVDSRFSLIQQIMWDKVGILRDAAGLSAAVDQLQAIARPLQAPLRTMAQFQVANLATVALLVARAALAREESRGGHFRTDFPLRDDARWRKHVVQSADRGLTVREG